MYRISHTVQRAYYNVIHKDVSSIIFCVLDLLSSISSSVCVLDHSHSSVVTNCYTHMNELTFFGALKTLSHESGELEATTRCRKAEYDWELSIGLCF